MKNIAISVDLDNNNATELKIDSLDGGVDDEHNGVNLVEISFMCVTQDDFIDGARPFDRVNF